MPKLKKDNLERIQVNFEVKQILDEDDGFFRFEGLASTFGNIDLVDDVVLPGAFKESLAEKMPIILWQHFTDEPIGMPETIFENSEGLFLRAKLPKEDTLVSGRVIPQIKVGSVRTMSIGFRIKKGGMFIDDKDIRNLTNLDLIEVSLVTFPANPKAQVNGYKSVFDFLQKIEIDGDKKDQIQDYLQKEFVIDKEALSFLDDIKDLTPRSLEKSLRDSGFFSKSAALKLVSVLNRSDSEKQDDALLNGFKNLNDKFSDFETQKQMNSILEKFGV